MVVDLRAIIAVATLAILASTRIAVFDVTEIVMASDFFGETDSRGVSVRSVS